MTDWALPQPIPHISHSFIMPQGPEMEASFTHEDIEEVIQDLSQLFCEVNMVQVGESTSHADVQLVGSGLSVDLVVHKLPTHPDFPPVQQKRRKFKPDVSEKIKEEIMKQLNANVIQTIRYTTWLANIVHVPKKDGKTRVCVDYRDLNKASPKDNFPLPDVFAWSSDDIPSLSVDLVVHKLPTHPDFPPVQQKEENSNRT
ncbi:uncharacterized protein [Solanum tuberosum]|uniref:uncharacterized protein n=1 Tax=Solanum tuberosum TaxID=4113 RepID=UPI00073A1917|nr:PREDICTED: uncharacterized protein LOC107061224 [Solanum tuberosum]